MHIVFHRVEIARASGLYIVVRKSIQCDVKISLGFPRDEINRCVTYHVKSNSKLNNVVSIWQFKFNLLNYCVN